MEKIKIKESFEHKRLEELGYEYAIMEGGYVSENGATIVSINRRPYEREVMQYSRNEEQHKENINKLRDIGALE